MTWDLDRRRRVAGASIWLAVIGGIASTAESISTTTNRGKAFTPKNGQSPTQLVAQILLSGMVGADVPVVRCAGVGEAHAIAKLLYDFNREFDEPTPPVVDLAERIADLLKGGDTVVLLIGDGPDGLAVLRFRAAIWSSGLECYLAELYVVPVHRGNGLGRALIEAVLREARNRGADTMEIGVDEPDLAARHLYESLGFSNRVGGAKGPVMYVYERDLHGQPE